MFLVLDRVENGARLGGSMLRWYAKQYVGPGSTIARAEDGGFTGESG